jgi:hypothetical protein
MLVTVFTSSLHWSLPWARLIQSITPHPIYVNFPKLRFSIRRTFPSTRHCLTLHNKITFYGELLVLRPTHELEDSPLSAVRNCLFSIFAATLYIWMPSPPSAIWGRAMPWWREIHFTCQTFYRSVEMSSFWHAQLGRNLWSLNLMMEIGPVSEISCFKKLKIMASVQNDK